MRARLAFALSLAIEFNCYLIDEVILVGDKNFQDKCRDQFFSRRQDRSILFASHSEEFVREFCTKAAVLHEGKSTLYDNVDEALGVYATL
jgi:capsular polysaccharide transport system ATP-binding protein